MGLDLYLYEPWFYKAYKKENKGVHGIANCGDDVYIHASDSFLIYNVSDIAEDKAEDEHYFFNINTLVSRLEQLSNDLYETVKDDKELFFTLCLPSYNNPEPELYARLHTKLVDAGNVPEWADVKDIVYDLHYRNSRLLEMKELQKQHNFTNELFTLHASY